MLRCLILSLLLALSPGHAEVLRADWREALQRLVEQGARAALPAQAELQVELGAADPRLRLAPCAEVQPYLPSGQRLWGRSRVGLRCVAGPARWAVSLPVQVRVFAPAWVAAQPLPAGVELQAGQLRRQTVELSAEASPALAQAEPPLGRVLAAALAEGQALRQAHLRPRQWFAAGAPVQLQLAGAGFAIRTEGQALGVGLDGASVRVRLDSGRIVLGQAVGPHRVELPW